MAKVRWGLLSTASIGRLVIEATRQAQLAEFVAVASRDAARARGFADELELDASFGSYEELLASEEVDAIYVALPVSMHTQWTVRSLAAGKHVLCEKPFATSAEDAARCFDAAASAGKLCAEGLMYRHHPQTALARKLVSEGALGRLTSVRAALSVSVDPRDIRRSAELGGGALLDLGCYCVSAVRLFAGQPKRVYAEQVRDGAAGIDLRLSATMRMPYHVLAQFDVGLDLPRRDELELIGTGGKLTIPDPWLCRRGYLELERDGDSERLPVDPAGSFGLVHPDHDVYRIELDTISAAIAGGEQPSFGRTDAVDQATVLQALRRSSEHTVPVGLGLEAPPAATSRRES
ncbi:MAG TPA: Gfo/Idh/MocA family oxidoreductase [Actinomycetes bacterium]|nr:Gfo/Idh/MocA family oxidoreductase [Actinomycetes bacterium]